MGRTIETFVEKDKYIIHFVLVLSSVFYQISIDGYIIKSNNTF